MTSQRFAVDGGSPVRTRPFGATREFGEADVAAVAEVIRSGRFVRPLGHHSAPLLVTSPF
jgi:hypothetical protein